MHIEPRLLAFTKGVRWRIASAVAIGLLSVGLGVARLGLLGWLIGQVFAGRSAAELALPIGLIALVMVLRGTAEHWRAVVAHETAARVQKVLRRTLYDLQDAAARISASGYPQAQDFAENNVLKPETEAEAIAVFERMAQQRAHDS